MECCVEEHVEVEGNPKTTAKHRTLYVQQINLSFLMPKSCKDSILFYKFLIFAEPESISPICVYV